MKAIISSIRKFGPYAHLVLQAPAIARNAQPGQFVEIKIEGAGAPFWRRPFSICQAQSGTIEVLIKTVGQGTRVLAAKKAGDSLDVIGPLGHGFSLTPKKNWLLVGGGFGVAPLMFLAERLRQKNKKVSVLIGGKCKEDILLRKELKLTGAEVACATEDGSLGTQGLITKLLQKHLEKNSGSIQVAASGPLRMLRAVAQLAGTFNAKVEVSLEEVMACGLGVCNGCVVKVADQYQRVCKDGPVFKAEEVAWDVK